MASIADDVERFERSLLVRCIGALEADRSRCSDCGRTPLIGEQVHLYEGAREPELVCELCSQLRRTSPLASETVRHSAHTVRVKAAAQQPADTALRPLV